MLKSTLKIYIFIYILCFEKPNLFRKGKKPKFIQKGKTKLYMLKIPFVLFCMKVRLLQRLFLPGENATL